MGNELTPTVTVSASSFQGFDGSNTTIAGFEGKLKGNGYYVSGFSGVSTDFKSTRITGVFDVKAEMNYDKKGITKQNLRIRNKFNNDTPSLQVRYSPLSVNIPVAKNTNLYVNPHYCGQINTDTNKWKHSAGIFVGATQKFGKTSISLEAQRYNLQNLKDNGAKNWSANVIVSYTF